MVLGGLIGAEEVEALRSDADLLISRALAGESDEDFFSSDADTGQPIPFRVEYVLEKAPATRCLLAHPGLLDSISQLQGEDFVPTWDSLVFKLPSGGASHPWHRDIAPYYQNDIDRTFAAIDVGIYLDDSPEEGAVRVLPASHHWSTAAAEEKIVFLNKGGSCPDVKPVPVQAGDAIFHNVSVIHGSPFTTGLFRRVIYFEFRQLYAEMRYGPHTANYPPLKRAMLDDCIRIRAGERPSGGTSYRIPHERHWKRPPAWSMWP